MRAIVVRIAALCGVGVSPFAASAAPAQLVMPFACHQEGGEVRLAPALLRTYAIYGAPEARAFSACSPNNPEMCRTWTLHRFDIDCGGARVSWLSVVGALTDWMPNRIWVSEGRLHVRMGPLWNRVSNAPCYAARPFGYGPWHRGGPALYGPCAAPMDSPGQVVTMPPGFAPMLNRFAQLEPASDAAFRLNDNARQSVERSAPPLANKPAKATAGDQAKAPVSSKSAEIVGSLGETPDSRAPTVHPAQQQQVAVAADELTATSDARSEPATRFALSLGEIWFAIVAVVFMSAIWLLWRREELADVAAVMPRAAAANATRHASRAPLRPQPPSSTRSWFAEDSDRLPSTRDEALQVLGASVDTGEAMLKEIVRTLRRKWHPDRARQEERPYRERKLKQINVAWDILRGRQVASRA